MITDQSMSELRSTEINAAAAPGEAQWSTYDEK
jgi:Mn-containing catalase